MENSIPLVAQVCDRNFETDTASTSRCLKARLFPPTATGWRLALQPGRQQPGGAETLPFSASYARRYEKDIPGETASNHFPDADENRIWTLDFSACCVCRKAALSRAV